MVVYGMTTENLWQFISVRNKLKRSQNRTLTHATQSLVVKFVWIFSFRMILFCLHKYFSASNFHIHKTQQAKPKTSNILWLFQTRLLPARGPWHLPACGSRIQLPFLTLLSLSPLPFSLLPSFPFPSPTFPLPSPSSPYRPLPFLSLEVGSLKYS